MKKFDSKSCEEIMTTVYKPIEFVVDGLIAQGLYILAGAPKVGKSWLSLDTCLSIAKGEKVLGHETKCGTTLYLCLEDSFERIQKAVLQSFIVLVVTLKIKKLLLFLQTVDGLLQTRLNKANLIFFLLLFMILCWSEKVSKALQRSLQMN